MKHNDKKWFEEWFNTPYYHLLYKHRDTAEASTFIDNLLDFLKPPGNAKILDLACGRGRHAIYLAQKGFDITGLDLSEENIAHAKAFTQENLHFFVHDMREVFRHDAFDYVFNLFTSFGYFEDPHENQRVITHMADMLKPGGKLVLDFINAEMVPQGESVFHEVIEGTDFYIRKIRNGNVVTKEITVSPLHGVEVPKNYREELYLFSLQDFEQFFREAGLSIKNIFGDYQLHTFVPGQSQRLILIGEKTRG